MDASVDGNVELVLVPEGPALTRFLELVPRGRKYITGFEPSFRAPSVGPGTGESKLARATISLRSFSDILMYAFVALS